MNLHSGKMNYPTKLLLLFFFYFHFNDITAQSKGRSWNAAAGIDLPFGLFSRTHFPGTGADISYSNRRFGRLPVQPVKQFGYLLNAGADYYFGKKENVSGHPFTYSGYFVFHTYGGVIWNRGKRINLNLAAGPALSVYNDKLRFNIGSNISATYFINGMTGVTPSVMLIKENGADWNGAVSIRGSWAF
jgi:hypothetical protein